MAVLHLGANYISTDSSVLSTNLLLASFPISKSASPPPSNQFYCPFPAGYLLLLKVTLGLEPNAYNLLNAIWNLWMCCLFVQPLCFEIYISLALTNQNTVLSKRYTLNLPSYYVNLNRMPNYKLYGCHCKYILEDIGYSFKIDFIVIIHI